MKVFQVNYFTGDSEAVSFVVAENEEQAEKMIDQNSGFELISINECDLSTVNIIHTALYETV